MEKFMNLMGFVMFLAPPTAASFEQSCAFAELAPWSILGAYRSICGT